eukprot:m.469018 g.469018  ORF g.469018 m.469018 type:complete len:99 (+) comp28029_c0_seq1:472-768(+)
MPVHGNRSPMSLVVFHSTDGGLSWDFRSVAVNYTQIPGMPPGMPNPYNLTHSAYGPQENGMALLADNRTVVIRTPILCAPLCPYSTSFTIKCILAMGG